MAENFEPKIVVGLDMASMKMTVRASALDSLAWAEIYIQPSDLDLPLAQLVERCVMPATAAVVNKWREMRDSKAQIA